MILQSSNIYVTVEFQILQAEQRELLSALLSDFGFEGIEELPDSLKGYIREANFKEADLREYLNQFEDLKGVKFTTQKLPNKNWNEAWEKSYEPIVVSDSVIIQASFHQALKKYPYEILIDPKMSFGTGHHETTQLMAEMMLGMNFENKSVLDFGSGTGVLSILAHKMKAKSVIAIDIDEWAYNNIIENIEKNQAKSIQPLQGGVEVIPNEQYEVILANVNKNIIAENMETLVFRLIKNGNILFSGLLLQDEDDIVKSAQDKGLILLEKKTKNEWLCLKFAKR